MKKSKKVNKGSFANEARDAAIPVRRSMTVQQRIDAYLDKEYLARLESDWRYTKKAPRASTYIN